MKNSAFSAHCADLTASDHRALADARLRRAHEALADQLIERRLDRDRIATLKLEVQDLKEQVGSLRRALDVLDDWIVCTSSCWIDMPAMRVVSVEMAPNADAPEVDRAHSITDIFVTLPDGSELRKENGLLDPWSG